MHDPLHEEQQSTEQVFDGKLLHVFRDEVRLPDGRLGLREYVRHPGAVVVIPVCEDGTLIFERQFRYPLRRAFLELPAGTHLGWHLINAAMLYCCMRGLLATRPAAPG